MYEYRAKLLRVVDGDTVHLEIDLGLETLRKINCRVYGINAPEMNTPEGKAAKIYLAGLLAPDADNLLVRTFKDRTEKYGRYLVRIETTHGSAAAAMVAAGHAVRYLVRIETTHGSAAAAMVAAGHAVRFMVKDAEDI